MRTSLGEYARLEEFEMASESVPLAADDELELAAKELSYEDPLNGEAVERHVTHPRSPWPVSRWRSTLSVLLRRSLGHQSTFNNAHDDRSNGISLLATDWSSRVAAKTGPTPWYLWLLPSWVHGLLGNATAPQIRRATDYLDGLRGVAALFVVFFHFLLGGMEGVIYFAYGGHDEWDPFALPFIRSIFAGEAMVAIFFVISGYVLTARCVIAMRAGEQEKVHTSLTSMAFRRAIRLFVPSIVGSACAVVVMELGLIPQSPTNDETLAETMWKYLSFLRRFLGDVWYWGDGRERSARPDSFHYYGPHLWTIPIEFMCSMLLFLLVLVVARCTSRVRFSILSVLTVWLLCWERRWEMALFVFGMQLAELNIISAEAHERYAMSITTTEDGPLPAKTPKNPLWAWLLFLIGWYLTGFPTGEEAYSPGYDFLEASWQGNGRDTVRFWLAVSAMMTVAGVSFAPALQRVFTTSIARYLGRVSYAFYVVHFYTHYTWRDPLWRMFSVIEDGRGIQSPVSVGFACALITYLIGTLWVADIFYRAVDAPAVRLAKWLEGKMFARAAV